MSDRTRLGLGVLAAAALLGVLGDALLRATPWGLNLVVCAAALLGVAVAIIRWRRLPVPSEVPWLALTALLCAAAYVRRDSAVLHTLDVLAFLGALALASWRLQGRLLRTAGITTYLQAAARSLIDACIRIFPLAIEVIRWRELQDDGRTRRARAIGMGALISLPLLVVFGGLFMAADPVFESFVTDVLRVDLAAVAEHGVLIGVWGALAGGFLWGALGGRSGSGERTANSPGLGFATVGTVLGLVDLLFVLFVALQARYLFGGAAVVEQTAGFTYSEFARRGFFELATAAGLALPVLLAADWALLRTRPQDETSFRALAGLLLLLLGGIMGSAVQRMLLYVDVFGLTELRLYPTAFMAWLAGVCVWFAWTVLRGRRHRFAFGTLVQGWAVLAGLHLLNPDAFVARTNAARVGRNPDRGFDVAYVGGLGADAVPVLLEAFPRLTADEQCIAARVLARWRGTAGGDWRTWNWARAKARRLVRQQDAALRRVSCPPPEPLTSRE